MSHDTPPSSFSPGSPLYRHAAIAYAPYVRVRDAWLSAVDAPRDLEILDVGCSRGDALARWAGANRVVGFDMDPAVLAEAEAAGYAETLCGDVLAADFGDRRFDGLAAFGMVGLSPRVEADLSRYHGLLKPGGRAWFIIAVLGGLRRISRPVLAPFGGRYLQSVETEAGLRRALAEAGFTLDSFALSNLYFDAAPKADPGFVRRLTSHYAYVEARAAP